MLALNIQELLVLFSTPVYLSIILFEVFLTNLKELKSYSWNDVFQNLYLMLVNTSLVLLVRSFYVLVLSACVQVSIFELKNTWFYWVTLVIAVDFVFYWLHRLEHSVRLFWAVHVTHHSSAKFNFTVGFRSSVFQPLYRFVFFIPIAFMGFHALDILLVFSACQIWGILVHTEMVNKLGWIEYVLVTPSHHRVHHASNPLYLDKNMGMLLIIWDKLFKTFQPELNPNDYQPIKFGLTKQKHHAMPFSVIFHEWQDLSSDLKQKISFNERLQYLFGPPGWSHDGSRLTSEQLRKKEAMQSLKDSD